MDPLAFLTDIFNIGIGSVTLGAIVSALILLLLCIFVIKFVMKVINGVFEGMHMERGLRRFLCSTINVVLYLLAGLIIADKIGIPVTSLVAALSVVGVAVSLAIQGSLSNLAGGVMLMVTKPFMVGDFVEAGGVSGTVSDVGIAYTKMTTPDNKTICCPNSEIAAAKIINYTAEKARRIDINITASYDAALSDVKAALLKCAEKYKGSNPTGNKPFAAVSSYNDSAIEYVLRVWVETGKYWDIYFALLSDIKEEFDAANIEMTYPHMNVHIVEK